MKAFIIHIRNTGVGMRNFNTVNQSFFHRPLWTTENRRFWFILSLVSLLLLTLNLIFINWSLHVSRERITQHIKTNYAVFLAQYKKSSFARVMEKDYATESVQLEREIKANRKSAARNPSENIIPQPVGLPDISAETFKTDTLGLTTITSAVEAVPGYAGIDRYQLRQEKFIDLQNRERIFRTQDNRIQIPVPEVLHFASQNGMRDLQETTAILEMNEDDIKYCFEKVARYDPAFSASVLISFTIHPDGYVIPASVKIIRSNIHDPRVLDCIRKQIQRWRNFNQIAFEDGNFTVTRKYIF